MEYPWSSRLIRGVLKKLGIRARMVELHGQKIIIPIDGYPLRMLLTGRNPYHEYEGGFFGQVASRLDPSDVVFDIGAYVGMFSAFVAKTHGDRLKVFAFEPNPDTQVVLNELLSRNDLRGVTVVPHLIGSSSGRLAFRKAFNVSGAVPEIRGEFGDGSTSVSVEGRTLDDEAVALGVQPTVLKIDVEGFELEVLRGASKTIRDVRLVACEVHPAKLLSYGSSEDQVCSQLTEYGFTEVFRHRSRAHRADTGLPYHAIFERRRPAPTKER
jgi:FkbM family methyltransferase